MRDWKIKGGWTMEKSVLIRKNSYDCPLCDTTHEVEERERTTTILIKERILPIRRDFIFVPMWKKRERVCNWCHDK